MTEESKVGEDQRMLNVGVEVKLKSLGTVTVRELTLEAIVVLGSDLAQIVGTLNLDQNKEGGMSFLVDLLKNEETTATMRKLAASSTGKQVSDFVDMGLLDWFKLAKAFKVVMDWEELQELFFEVFPTARDWMKKRTDKQE